MRFNFALLDPRPIPAAAEANDKVLQNGNVLGIEVTVPALAARCDLGNIDPQHTGGQSELAAIEVALTAKLPPDGATLATVRPDLDAVGAMAVLLIRATDSPEKQAEQDSREWREGWWRRVNAVAAADKFARGGWPGPKLLPTAEQPWDDSAASAESTRELAAIAAAVADFKVPINTRVEWMAQWLETGAEPKKLVQCQCGQQYSEYWSACPNCKVDKADGRKSPETSYRQLVEAERRDMIVALEGGAIERELSAEGRIAVVTSTHRAATSVGYSLAPVVVALNPEFRLGGGEPHAKFTICQFTGEYVNLRAVLAELQALEPGWGGSPTLIGSPQGVASKLTTEQVVEVVAKHLK